MKRNTKPKSKDKKRSTKPREKNYVIVGNCRSKKKIVYFWSRATIWRKRKRSLSFKRKHDRSVHNGTYVVVFTLHLMKCNLIAVCGDPLKVMISWMQYLHIVFVECPK